MYILAAILRIVCVAAAVAALILAPGYLVLVAERMLRVSIHAPTQGATGGADDRER